MIRVVLAMCDTVMGLHTSERPFGLSRTDCSKIAYKSIKEPLKNIPHKLTVIADRITDDLRSIIDDEIIENKVGGIHETRRLQVLAASEARDSDILYIAEDDYAHSPDWADSLIDLFENRKRILSIHSEKHLYVHLPDYIDRYYPKKWNDIGQEAKFHIFLGTQLHWRQIYNTTNQLICSAETFSMFKDMLVPSIQNNDSTTLNRVYRLPNTLCLSPIPGLSHHLDVNVPPTPGRDWPQIARQFL